MKQISNKLLVAVITVVAVSVTSCRPQGDDLLSYGHNDEQAFAYVEGTHADLFKMLWVGMNENYCIWDFEAAHGLDWDEVFNTYLPQFEALDKRNDIVTDDELKALYCQFMDSLLDGHMYVKILNISTGNYVTINPNSNRNRRERGDQLDAEGSNVTTLDVYRTTAVDANYQIKQYDATGSALIIAEEMDSVASRIVRASKEYIEAVEALGGPTPLYDSLYTTIVKMNNSFDQFRTVLRTNTEAAIQNSLSDLVAQFNNAAVRYALAASQLGITIMPIEQKLANDELKSLRFALFDGNIAYLRIGAFGLSSHLEPNMISSDTTSLYYAYQMAVNRVWHQWFDTIQALHAAGQLGGVILDVRNNGGGMVDDYKYAVGALLPSGGWAGITLRVKNGPGRLDFGPLVPLSFPTYPGKHAVIKEEPIVVLANSNSGSLAENTTCGVISQPNGYFVGTRTYGALSALSTAPQAYSQTYSGAFGEKDVTPVYGSLPKYVCLYGDDLHIAEGHGFDPDKEVQLDVNLFQSTGRDNQLEAALDYIHSK